MELVLRFLQRTGLPASFGHPDDSDSESEPEDDEDEDSNGTAVAV